MNDYDSAKLAALLKEQGYGQADAPEEADFIIVNTCSVRKNAEDRAIAFLSSQKPLKKEGKKLCLFGCTASLYGRKLFEKHKFIDIICGPNNYNDAAEILRSATKSCFTGDSENPFIDALPETGGSISAPVTVTKGCENFCSYCVVPFTRGRLLSKSPEKICEEIEHLAEKGVKEFILLGQNVNEYGKDTGATFAQLLREVHNLAGVVRIGFTTSHPKDVPCELIRMLKELPKLYKHLHLPLQSGSDRILKLMNRKYTLAGYKETVCKAREAFPGICITSDIITGYPSETPDDFSQTCKAVGDIVFDDLFVFKYSHRPGTAASREKDDVPAAEKERRHRIILDLQDGKSYLKNKEYEGRICDVFARNASSKKAGFLVGRTETNKPVFFKSQEINRGKILKVEIKKAQRRYLEGRLCDGK